MRRRRFQEVALSLTEPGTILHEESRDQRRNPFASTSLSGPTPVESAAAAFASNTKSVIEHWPLQQQCKEPLKQQLQRFPLQHEQQLQQQPQQQHQCPHHSAQHQQLVKQLSRHSVRSTRQQPKHPLSRSSTSSTLQDSESDSADFESTPFEVNTGQQATITSGSPVSRLVTSVRRKAKTVGRTVAAISRSALSSGRSSSESSPSAVQKPIQVRPQHTHAMENIGVERRVDGWQTALKEAIEQDIQGHVEDALQAYDRLNRNITKGAIYDYEKITCDQKKLLTQVLTCVDMRTQQLRIQLEGSRAQIHKAGLGSTGHMSKGSVSEAAEAMALEELSNCIEVLDTLQRMVSKTKVPVVLVYRERKIRTHHRHEDKGHSNKVVFAKEKRDFLSLMGLPGAMITEKGLDLTVRPNTATAIRKLQEEGKNNNANRTTDTTDVGEIEPDEKNGGTAVQTDDEDTDSPKSVKKNLLNYLPFMKKAAVSPHPDSDDPDYDLSSDDDEVEPKEKDEALDARSTLSCDTCSSSGSSDSDEDFDDGTDMVVTGATYAHRESIQPPPFRELGSTYVTLALEKMGVKNTSRIICPFLRVSVRDCQGNLVTPGFPQETAEWEVVNRNTLRAQSQIHLQRPLDDLSDDAAIFLELRNYRPQKNIISTVCYTFLEKHRLSDGSYICELYSTPVDFTRKNLKIYTEKAFFLHLEIILKQASCEVQTLESPKSSISS